METANPHKNIEFRLQGLEIVKFAVHPSQQTEIKDEEFNFNIDIRQTINPTINQILVHLDIKVLHINNDELGYLTTFCIFKVKSFDELPTNEQNQVELPEDFMNLLNQISISTSRGIMFSLFNGTILRNALLPLISSTKLIHKG